MSFNKVNVDLKMSTEAGNDCQRFMSFHVVLCSFMSFHVVACHFMSFYVVLCRFMSFYVVLCRFMYCDVAHLVKADF